MNDLGARQLAQKIASGEISSLQAVEACFRRIDAVDGRINAMPIKLHAQALAEARAVDEKRARGEALGPLGGVPISIKECFDLEGTASTAGIVARAQHRATKDSPLVARLRAAGAIVLGKTNVAQLLYSVESSNPLYGRVNNPWDLARTPGGSSGGEAALIACGGSHLGLGTDIGGSIRLPAHFCGIHGLRPTAGRLPPLGAIDAEISPQEAIVDSAGPLARQVEDLALALSILNGVDLPVPLGDFSTVNLRGLRVGFYDDDGFVRAGPAPRRAVAEAREILRGRGVEVVKFAPPDAHEAVRLYLGLMGADGAACLKRILDGSAADPTVSLLFLGGPRRRGVRRVLARILDFAQQKRLAEAARSYGRITVDQYWQLLAERAAYRAKFFAALDEQKLDALICPPLASAAFPHGHWRKLGAANHYALVFNLIGLPAGVVAATRVRDGEESDRETSRDVVTRAILDGERGTRGLPVGVQVAARMWREDVVLAIMAALEEEFRVRPDYPARPPI